MFGIGLGAWCSEIVTRRCWWKANNGLKPIPEEEVSQWARIASQSHRRATRKKRVELRRLGLPMIIWNDGRVREIPA